MKNMVSLHEFSRGCYKIFQNSFIIDHLWQLLQEAATQKVLIESAFQTISEIYHENVCDKVLQIYSKRVPRAFL